MEANHILCLYDFIYNIHISYNIMNVISIYLWYIIRTYTITFYIFYIIIWIHGQKIPDSNSKLLLHWQLHRKKLWSFMVEIAMSLLEDVSNLLKFHAKNIQKSWLSGGIHIFKSKKSPKKSTRLLSFSLVRSPRWSIWPNSLKASGQRPSISQQWITAA